MILKSFTLLLPPNNCLSFIDTAVHVSCYTKQKSDQCSNMGQIEMFSPVLNFSHIIGTCIIFSHIIGTRSVIGTKQIKLHLPETNVFSYKRYQREFLRV